MKQLNDATARQLALDPKHSFIVQAPAGSGKTSLLIQRYLSLLANACSQPEEILAITFTRKAAAEMRTRIIAALHQAQELTCPTDPNAQLTWQLATKVLSKNSKLKWNLLLNPHRLNIHTIDAFCYQLASSMPILAGCGSSIDILNTATANESYLAAAGNLLNEFAIDTPFAPALENLLLHLDNDLPKAQKLLAHMLTKRDQWLPHIVPILNSNQNRETLELHLQSIIDTAINNCENNLPPELADEIFSMASIAGHDIEQQDRAMLWHELASLLLTKEDYWRKKVTYKQGFLPPAKAATPEEKKQRQNNKQRMLELLSALPQYEAFRIALCDINYLPPPHYSPEQWQLLTSLMQLLVALSAHLQLVFKDKRAVDYIEVALAALRALNEQQHPTELALHLDYKLHHILVDEFQDTSVTQYQLLEQLTAAWDCDNSRTLFLVGDPMQSIYKFREAKVGLFIKAQQEGINAIKLTPLTLTTNFRSNEKIIAWLNSTFPLVMPKTEEIANGAIPFSPSTANPNRAHTDSGIVTHIHKFGEKDRQSEAERIVKIIHETQVKEPTASIAILVRYRSHLTKILPALKLAQISFVAPELDLLVNHSITQDLLALTKALLNPCDKIAWLAILRAPWCGLQLMDLHAIVKHSAEQPLWLSLQQPEVIPNLSEVAKQRLANFVPIVAVALKSLRQHSLRQLIETTWNNFNGPNCLSNSNDLLYAKNYFSFLAANEHAGDIENIFTFEQQLAELYVDANENLSVAAGLYIMTMHKAKGLEFDTVIIPGLDFAPHQDDSQLLLWMERPSSNKHESELILAPIKPVDQTVDPIYRYLTYENRKKNHYETGRLLYVATTRAKEELHLLACIEDKPAAGSLLEQIWSSFIDTNATQETAYSEQSLAETKITNNTLRRLTLSAMGTPINSTTIPVLPTPIVFSPENSTAQNIGTVIHNQLLELSMLDLNTIDAAALANMHAKWQHQLLQLGTYSDLEQHLELIHRAITNCLSDTRCRWILSREHKAAKSEFPVTLNSNSGPQHLIIDRTFIADGYRWIIDYKTATPKPGTNLDLFMTEQAQQYRIQLENYALAMSRLDSLPIRLALYFPLLPAWHELARLT